MAFAPYLLTWKSAARPLVMRQREKKMMNVDDLEMVSEDIIEWCCRFDDEN